MTRHYFDWAASAIPDTALLQTALQQSLDTYANPSAKHSEGRSARASLEDARSRCAAVLGVPPASLYFTSGGTESNALVLQSPSLMTTPGSRLPGTGLSAGSAPASIALFSAIEHPSVLDNARLFKAAGCAVHQIKPDTDGRVSPDAFGRALEKALSRDGADNASQSRRLRLRLVAVMAVNNETGAIQDIPALVGVLRAFCREHGLPPVHFHCDAVQAIGKTALDLAACGIDSAALSAHKLGGPRGIGLLYLRRKLETLSTGGHQEGGIRSGTENLFGALGLALALENQAAASIPPDASTAAVTAAVTAAIARFVRLITALRTLPACSTIPADRTENDPRFSPYILQLRCPGIPGEVMVRALDDLGIAVSTGSACSSNSPRRVVLEAMGLAPSHAFEGFRISQGWSTTDEDIDALVDGIRRVLEQTARIQTKG